MEGRQTLFPQCKRIGSAELEMKSSVLVILISTAFLAAAFAQSLKSEDGFVLVPAGGCTMGSAQNEKWREDDETLHAVKINSFYCDPFEVRQSDFEKVMGRNPSRFKGANLPVENVTWFDAIEYCNRLSAQKNLLPVYTILGDAKSGRADVIWNRVANGYRLLTESEWEYACRAGTTTRYSFGNQVHSDFANFEGTYPYSIEDNYVYHTDASVKSGRALHRTLSVDSFSPNKFGIYNMHGNVSEWCFDFYAPYNVKDSENPAGSATGHLRVNRGGSFNDFGKHLRSCYRSATNPIDVDENLGFRICRNADTDTEYVHKVLGEFATTYDLNIAVSKNPRILVAYFSYSGNTARGAKLIAEMTGGDLFEIQMQRPYSGGIYEASQKDLRAYYKPTLASHVKNMAQYDVILLGYPTWWGTLPMPVVSFLEEYDFSGKTIVNFSSHGGTKFGDSVSALSKKALQSYIGIGYEWEYSRHDRKEIEAWLLQNGIPKK